MLKSNKLLTYDYIEDIEKSFSNFGASVSNTIELNNVLLTYSEADEPKTKISSEDLEERKWLLEEIKTAIAKIEIDRETRKAIIYNLHVSELEHNCLNIFHLYYRRDRLNMNVYARSMNFDDNFKQDLYTFSLILDKACKQLNLNKGEITLLIMSLHKYI